MTVTIKDIAQKAGVSRGTVDRVLHNRRGVNKEVAEHVRKIADELGFTPNRAGKILKLQKKPISICCLLPETGNPFFADVVTGFEKAANDLKDFGLSITIEYIKGLEPEAHVHAIKNVRKNGYSALCLTTIDVPIVQLEVQKIIQSGIPVISVNTDIVDTDRLCYVGPDYFNHGLTAASLLTRVEESPIKVLIVTGSRLMRGHNERIRGFTAAIKKYAKDFSIVTTVESLDNNEFAYIRTKEALQKYKEINSIFIVAAVTGGVCKAVVDLGLNPHIISFDSVPETKEYIKQGIIDFTICQEPEQQGVIAVRKMFDYFMDEKKIKPEDYITGTIIKIAENIDV